MVEAEQVKALPGVDRAYTKSELATLKRFNLLFTDPSLDLIIRSFLQDHASVHVSATSTDSMTGLGTQALNDIIGTGHISARQYAQRNQKIQTKALEWMHWKQWALSHGEFEKYRNDFVLEIPRLRIKAAEFLLSDTGRRFQAYETFPGRGFSITIFVCIIIFSNIPGWAAAWGISKTLENRKGLTIIEYLMQHILKKPPLNVGPLAGKKYSQRLVVIRDLVIGGHFAHSSPLLESDQATLSQG